MTLPKIEDTIWDQDDDPEGNVVHIAKHGVEPREVREVLQSAPVFFREYSEGANPYYVAIGYTVRGRLLEVHGVYYQSAPLIGYWRTTTAMDVRAECRKLWLKERGGNP